MSLLFLRSDSPSTMNDSGTPQAATTFGSTSSSVRRAPSSGALPARAGAASARTNGSDKAYATGDLCIPARYQAVAQTWHVGAAPEGPSPARQCFDLEGSLALAPSMAPATTPTMAGTIVVVWWALRVKRDAVRAP